MSNILIVHAHPEAKSLTSALKDVAIETLGAQGHAIQVSDLYASSWKAVADRADFTEQARPERFSYLAESRHAYASGTQAPDIELEQQKLLWANAVLFTFPLWWFGMPAILKGWVDRVFAYGFAYGIGVHGGGKWGDRYGEGTLSGRRAMLTITIGGREAQYAERGVNGRLDDVLWPIQHGMLFYPGMSVLPPFVVYQSERLTEKEWPGVADAYRRRISRLFTDDPIPFRTQNGGHYDEQQVLKPGLGAGESGTRIHLLQPGDPPEVLPSKRTTAPEELQTSEAT
jgi:NAD(P)H dehydrogenase (quinone)